MRRQNEQLHQRRHHVFILRKTRTFVLLLFAMMTSPCWIVPCVNANEDGVVLRKATTVDIRIALNDTITDPEIIDSLCSILTKLGNTTCASLDNNTKCTQCISLNCQTENDGATIHQKAHIISVDDPAAVEESIASLKTSFETPSTVNQALLEDSSNAFDGSLTVTAGSLSVPTDFNYRVEFKDADTTISFAETTASEELNFNYNISDKPAKVTLFYSDCTTSLPDNDTSPLRLRPLVRTDGIPITYENVNVKVDVAQESIQDVTNGLWLYDESTSEGIISFCMRMSLYYDTAMTTSVNFHETKVRITIDMSTDFSVNSIQSERDNETMFTADDIETNYDITAYKCDWSGSDTSSAAISQGDPLFICVQSSSNSIQLEEVLNLNLVQPDGPNGEPGGSQSPIVDGDITGLAEADCTFEEHKKCIIQTIAPSMFFTRENTNNIQVNGNVLLSFARRQQRQLDQNHPNRAITSVFIYVDANGQQTSQRTLHDYKHEEDHGYDSDSTSNNRMMTSSSSGSFAVVVQLEPPAESVEEAPFTNAKDDNSIDTMWLIIGGLCLLLLFVFVMYLTFKCINCLDSGKHGLVSVEKQLVSPLQKSKQEISSSTTRTTIT